MNGVVTSGLVIFEVQSLPRGDSLAVVDFWLADSTCGINLVNMSIVEEAFLML